MLHESSDDIKTRILDFGRAKPLKREDGLTDIAEVVRKCTALYGGQEFNDEKDMKDNWEDKIKEVNIIFFQQELFFFIMLRIFHSNTTEILHVDDINIV